MNKTILRKRAFCLFLLLCFTLLPFSSVHAQESGFIRVLLTKLNLTNRIDITLEGSYTVGNIAFQRGSNVVVTVQNNTLLLYYEGIVLNAKDTLTFYRHQVDNAQENGVRINGKMYLHPGDLIITHKEGQLQCVLNAPIEEYLLGVVPYEMSDSFPLEALKAQAVAARTYALSKINTHKAYDVVDNTNDQAYYGILHTNTNAKKAVEQTKGMVCMYKNKLAICYYTASNGGQVELVQNVWGQGDYDYITMHDDPYDIQNKESVVKKAEIKKNITSDSDLQGLAPYLKDGLVEQLKKKGFDTQLDNIKINTIKSITLSAPKDNKDSKVMTKAQFALTVTGKKQVTQEVEEEVSIFVEPKITPTPAPNTPTYQEVTLSTPLTVEIDIFPTLEKIFSLSINGGNNEIITVTEKEDVFLLESRRYGHGVGMSQRGAQVLGRDYNYTYDQILSFYYPKATLKTMTYAPSNREKVHASFLSTPAPPLTPTPRPTLMPALATLKPNEYKVTVTNIKKNSFLNMREEPNTSCDVLGRLYYGQPLIVIKQVDENWLKVKTDVMEGYIMQEFVEKVQ